MFIQLLNLKENKMLEEEIDLIFGKKPSEVVGYEDF